MVGNNRQVIMMDHMGTKDFTCTIMIAGKKYMLKNFDDAMVLINAIHTSSHKGIDLTVENLYESYPYVGIIVEELPDIEMIVLSFSASVDNTHAYSVGDRIRVFKETIEEWPPAALIIKE
jgi:hypothetical protein